MFVNQDTIKSVRFVENVKLMNNIALQKKNAEKNVGIRKRIMEESATAWPATTESTGSVANVEPASSSSEGIVCPNAEFMRNT